jgi:hypothetical protein
MIIVHQMAKVASLSWLEAARATEVSMQLAPMHSHFIVEKNLDQLARVLAVPGERQTMSNLLIPRVIVRRGRAAAAAIATAIADGRQIRLICGMRDPVARSLSVFSYFADICGHKQRVLSGRNAGASVETVVEALTSTWESIYSHDEPVESFEWLLYRMIGLYRTWFTEELLEPFGVDVRSSRIPEREGALRGRNGNVEVLVYRVEDMLPSAPAYERLRAAAADFLQTPLSAWPQVNQSESRLRSRAFNQQVQRAFRLPNHLLDAIYSEPIVTHFYGPEEIATFRSRWS